MRMLGANNRSSSGDAAVGRAAPMEPERRPTAASQLKCPRCDSTNTKFCYYNNYSLSQPRHFCKACKRYWTRGGTLRNVPVGGGCRKNKRLKLKQQPPRADAVAATTRLLVNGQSLTLPPPPQPPPPPTSFPKLPPSATGDDDRGASPSSMLYSSLPALPAVFRGGPPTSCTGTAFDLIGHHAHASLGSGAGLRDPMHHRSRDEYDLLGSGGLLLEHLPRRRQRLADDEYYSLLLPPRRPEEEEEQEQEAAAASLLFDQQMMIMMNSSTTEWQIPTDQNMISSSRINSWPSSFSSPSYAHLKEASSSIVDWPDAAASNYRWSATTATAAHPI